MSEISRGDGEGEEVRRKTNSAFKERGLGNERKKEKRGKE